ncbi:MAG: NAD(P)/FAD-dependent oxidoreductase [Bacteroidota bacterium]|nr:NAD(P)/FAD-dependent oxidoreductase [Candidatus Kapabacteria bacterium]MDW8219735.1 NAD(P)/FAD-dependent oxidoreductase [Bacteroidota bacterium]
MITTDILVIGAGPCGLFTAFEAGLLKLRCHFVDYLPVPGGQCAELYPKKPIYDIPGYPSILAGDLIQNLLKQIEPFKPGFTLGERAETIEKLDNEMFRTVTSRNTEIHSRFIVIAGGLGCFAPRKPDIPYIAEFESKGVEYIVRNPEDFRGKKVVIAGGGDSALDWTLVLAEIAAELTLVHRSKQFRAAPDSVQKMEALVSAGKISFIPDANVTDLRGNGVLNEVVITKEGGECIHKATDFFIPLFGLSPQLGPIANWGLALEKHSIRVNPHDYSTSIEGIYAVGDIAEYPNKLKLILTGFHEAAVACHAINQKLNPNKKHVIKYTTISGIQGF